MKYRLQRTILVVVAAATLFHSFIKGHAGVNGRHVAFFCEPPGVYVKISGNIEKPGIYKIISSVSQKTAISLTLSDVVGSGYAEKISLSSVHGGSHIDLKEFPLSERCVSTSSMAARDCVTLGMPLDVNALTASDWEWLPEIGPKTAAAIVKYRQQNGGFSSLEELEMVPGIGPKRISTLKSLFIGKSQ